MHSDREVSHDRADEDLRAKARWFAGFTPEERLRMLRAGTRHRPYATRDARIL